MHARSWQPADPAAGTITDTGSGVYSVVDHASSMPTGLPSASSGRMLAAGAGRTLELQKEMRNPRNVWTDPENA
jgi:hypothetical protein